MEQVEYRSDGISIIGSHGGVLEAMKSLPVERITSNSHGIMVSGTDTNGMPIRFFIPWTAWDHIEAHVKSAWGTCG